MVKPQLPNIGVFEGKFARHELLARELIGPLARPPKRGGGISAVASTGRREDVGLLACRAVGTERNLPFRLGSVAIGAN